MSVDALYNRIDVYLHKDKSQYIIQPDQWATDGTNKYIGSVTFNKHVYPNKQLWIDVSNIDTPSNSTLRILDNIGDKVISYLHSK